MEADPSVPQPPASWQRNPLPTVRGRLRVPGPGRDCQASLFPAPAPAPAPSADGGATAVAEGALGAQYLRRLNDGERVVLGTVEVDDCRTQLRMSWGKSANGERGEPPT